MGRIWAVLIGLVVITAGVAIASASDSRTRPPEPANEGGNLLANPSFEGDYHPYDPDPEIPDCPSGICNTVQMADNWTPWWVKNRDTDVNPEYKPAEVPERVHSGERAQQYFSLWRTHEAGFYQRAAVQSGQEYCFRIWGHAWSSDQDDPTTSNSVLEQKVGLDPTGGTEWDSPNVEWGPTLQQYDVYGRFIVCATAVGNHVTVFTHAKPMWAVKHNDVHWDSAELVPNDISGEMVVTPSGPQVFMSTVDAPQVFTRTLTIDLPSDPWLTWYAEVEPGGTLSPELVANRGVPGEILTFTVDSEFLGPGAYSADINITSYPVLPGSPTIVPVTLLVFEQNYPNYLPATMKP